MECHGPATVNGFYYFYPLVRPGDAPPAARGRFTIPRPQTPEVCQMHNGTIPRHDRTNTSGPASNRGVDVFTLQALQAGQPFFGHHADRRRSG